MPLVRHLPVVLLLASIASACGDSPTGPTASARVEAVIQDSPSGTAVTGTLAGNIFASVGDGSRWVDVGSPNGITVPLQIVGRTTTVHGEASIAAGTYNRVRLVFQGVAARITRGSTVGDRTLTSDVNVTLGGSDERAEIIVSVDRFVIDADASAKRLIVFDLRSQQWLTAGAVQTGQVEDSALQAAISATTRRERR